MTAFRVAPYSLTEFSNLLVEKAHNQADVRWKSHIRYLDEYFGKIGVKTIVAELSYTDKHYLEDYAAYYSRCFDNYQKQCARLHFFTDDISETEFSSALDAKSEFAPRLQSSYAGFIVVKPLPQTVIGRTCLKSYSTSGTDRYFPVCQRYDVNLFGYPLYVESLAFQEQDTDVAACATSSLWSTFQATGRLFQHAIPSPVEITQAASSLVRLTNRTIPNQEGLTAEQMADAIRSVGLEPHAIQTGDIEKKTYDANLLRVAAYAYLRGGIPCLSCGELIEVATGDSVGLHAIALTGYRISNTLPAAAIQLDSTDIFFKSTRLDRLYAHDDAVGPFARLRFGNSTNILTSWQIPSGSPDTVEFRPYIFIVPIYHKIRIPFLTIGTDIVEVDQIIETGRVGLQISSLSGRGEWDVYLLESGKLKKDVLSMPSTKFDRDVLEASLPKHLWVADYYDGTSLKARLMFDATDLLQGDHFLRAILYDDTFGAEVANFSAVWSTVNPPTRSATKAILAWFSQNYP